MLFKQGDNEISALFHRKPVLKWEDEEAPLFSDQPSHWLEGSEAICLDFWISGCCSKDKVRKKWRVWISEYEWYLMIVKSGEQPCNDEILNKISIRQSGWNEFHSLNSWWLFVGGINSIICYFEPNDRRKNFFVQKTLKSHQIKKKKISWLDWDWYCLIINWEKLTNGRGDIVLQFDCSHSKHSVTGMAEGCCDWDVVQGFPAANHHSKLTELLGT